MKAVLLERGGSPTPWRYRDIATPRFGDHDVLVKVRAAAANAGDASGRSVVRGLLGWLRPFPNIPGTDIAGHIAAVGRRVTEFRPGDAVFGSLDRCGGFAEYASVPETALVHKPAAATFEQAAAVPLAALAALQGLRNVGQVRAGYDVLINDASSGIGTFAVQIAKSCGAAVTGICQGRHVPLVRSIGADDALDAGHAEFAPRGHHYDLVLDAGGDRPFEDFIDVLKPRGTYVMVGGSFARRCRLAAARPLRRLRGGRRVESLRVQHNRVDLLFLSHLMDSGAVTPVIDRRYRLSEVPEAFHYLAQGHAAGKVVIAIDRESRPSSHRPPAA